MQRRMMRMTKAFIIGTMEAVTAVIMVLRALTRPKRRMTRKARMSLTSQSGKLLKPCPARETRTMTTSNQFQPLRKKRLEKLAKMLKSSSVAKAKVKRLLTVASRRPKDVSEPSCLVSAAEYWASRTLVTKFCSVERH